MQADDGRRRLLRLVGGGVVLAALPALGGCDAEPPDEAVAAWRGPGDEPDVRRWALSWAILAPHSHNLQSWRVDLRQPGEILLSVDLERLLPATDPFFRQIMMSHGTFLEALDLAAQQRGLRAEVALFPQGPYGRQRIDDRPLARIRLLPRAASAGPADPLFAQLARRRTHRGDYQDRPLPAAAWAAMAQAAAGVAPVAGAGALQFGSLGLPGAPGVRGGPGGPGGPDEEGAAAPGPAEALARHRAIAAEAWAIEMRTPAAVAESWRWLRVGREAVARHRDGISVLDPQAVLLARLGLFDTRRPPGPGDYATRSQISGFQRRIDGTGAFVWLTSQGNERVTQVQAGRAWLRVQLAGCAHGVVMQPLQQALQEYPEQAGPHAAVHALLGAGAGRTVQMWARAGQAEALPPAPRRGLAAQLVA